MNLTSLLVKGVPSDHVTPSRRVKVMIELSSLNSQAVASQGTSSLVIVL